ncbi:MAG: ABC transporter substrate-binding protein [Holosporales bacterium]|nr:ABC transporter substrate-binding protein [Holosporales bacterium]
MISLFCLGPHDAFGNQENASEQSIESVQKKPEIIIKITCGCKALQLKLCQQAAEEWEKITGNRVEIITLPNESNERLNLFLQLFRSKSRDVDIFLVDVTWPGVLANYLIDLRKHFKEKEISEFYEVIINNNTVRGRLVAIPWYVDIGIFYYRKDLLKKYGHKIPTTWDELEVVAADIQNKERQNGNSRMWGYVFQGKSYEGLTVNAMEWFFSVGGSVTGPNGESIIDVEPNRTMLERVHEWIGSIVPSGVLGYTEEEARGVFQSGNAVFMRNWPYALALLNAPDCHLAGKVEATSLPAGTGAGSGHVGTLGGWSLGVSKFSQHQREAVAFVRFLTSYKEQKRRAIEGGISPTRHALYKDEELLTKQPFFAKLSNMLGNIVLRPAVQFGHLYNQASAEIFNSVHSMLAGNRPIDSALKQLHERLSLLLKKVGKQSRECFDGQD